MDTTESAATAATSPWRRTSPTRLLLTATRTGRAVAFVDDTTTESLHRVRFTRLGQLPGTEYAVVRQVHAEWTYYALVHVPTGDTLVVYGAPVLSPDRTRVLTATADLVEGRQESQLEVVALTADGPRREFSVLTADADTPSRRWAPMDARWDGTAVVYRHVALVGRNAGCRATSERLARGTDGTWRITADRR